MARACFVLLSLSDSRLLDRDVLAALLIVPDFLIAFEFSQCCER